MFIRENRLVHRQSVHPPDEDIAEGLLLALPEPLHFIWSEHLFHLMLRSRLVWVLIVRRLVRRRLLIRHKLKRAPCEIVVASVLEVLGRDYGKSHGWALLHVASEGAILGRNAVLDWGSVLADQT